MMIKKTGLILGSGYKTKPSINLAHPDETNIEVDWTYTRLDNNLQVKPDVCFDLQLLGLGERLPFPDNTFDSVFAFEVLEHIGRQGDYEKFFLEFNEYARVLKDGGLIIGSAPLYNSVWLWGDPGHTRYIGPETFFFLNADNYKEFPDARSDYSKYWKHCWRPVYSAHDPARWFFGFQQQKGT